MYLILIIAAWHFEPIPTATRRYLTLDVDTTGTPSVIYVKDSILWYAQRVEMADSFVWLAEIVDSGIRGSVDLAIDRQTNPHIMYSYSLYPSSLWIYTFKDTTGSWHFDTLDGAGAIDTDTLDYPHTCYHNFENDTIYHTFWDGANWIKEAVESRFPEWVSLVIDNKNRPHIAMAPAILKARQGYVAYGIKDSIGWHTELVENYDVREGVAIETDVDCTPHLAFVACFDPIPHYARKDSTWLIDTITLGSGTVALAIEGTIPHLLVYENGVRHIWKQGVSWQYEDIHSGWPDDLIIDDDNYLHCIIIDSLDIIYGTTRPQSSIYEQRKSKLSFHPIPTISRLPLRISTQGLESVREIKITDVLGRMVRKLSVPLSASEIIWNGLDCHNHRISPGVHFLIFESKGLTTLEKFLIIE